MNNFFEGTRFILIEYNFVLKRWFKILFFVKKIISLNRTIKSLTTIYNIFEEIYYK